MNNRILVISDTHLGHNKMVEYCGRPKDHSERIIKNLHRLVRMDDILIHTGDVCIGNDSRWHGILNQLPCKKWLVRGNHDRKSFSWYMSHGWDMVCDSFQLNKFKQEITFSHIPMHASDFTGINIHGHCHNNLRAESPEMKERVTDRHILVKCEHHYEPVLLRNLIKPG